MTQDPRSNTLRLLHYRRRLKELVREWQANIPQKSPLIARIHRYFVAELSRELEKIECEISQIEWIDVD